jgi:hypothetical protein
MKINIELLKELEKSIDTYNPDKGKIPINILGWGEISLVFELVNDPEPIAYKRIPIFDNEPQVKRHVWAYNEYNRLLKEDCGLNLPDYDTAWFKDDEGEIQFYCVQEKLPPDSVGHKIIHNISDKEIETLILLAMREMKKVWGHARTKNYLSIGLDGQISNFAVKNYDPYNIKISVNTELYYIDTSTPMFRINDKEAMEAVLFLKSTPSFLRGLIKAAFLQETVDRYYDWRKVTTDLVANFYKEQKPEIVPRLTRLVNEFMKEEAPEFEIEPLTVEEIKKYYKSDANMWRIFQAARKIDRFLETRLFRRKYAFYLPGKIVR